MQIVQRVLQRLEARPPWLRWLATAPLAVREAERSTRRAYFFQLACAVAVVCVYAGARYLGWLVAQPLVGAWLLSVGLAALAWPVYIARLAFAAHRGAASTTGSMASRLRALAFVAFALAGLLGIGLACLVALLSIVTVATLTEPRP